MDRKKLRKRANKPIHRNPNDAIEGQRILGIGRAIRLLAKPIQGSSSHRTQGAILKSDAFCIVDMEFKVSK